MKSSLHLTLLLLALPRPLQAEILVALDPAAAEYDGIAVDDSGAGGSASGIPDPDSTHADGFAFNITFIPETVDLSGTVMLMEIGGTSNGQGLYLVDGVPTFIGKQSSGDGVLPTGLNDTALPAIAVQSSVGALAAGTEYTFAAVWDHAGNLDLAVYDGTTLTPDNFTITGTPGDWSGNYSLSAGIQTNDGSTGGLSGNNAASDFGPPFDVDECVGLSRIGNICHALYWNDNAPIVSGSNDLVELATTAADYDSSADGLTSSSLAANTADGHVIHLTVTPALADLSGTVVLFEYGGTSNGTALALVDGVLTYCTKHDSGDNQAPDSLNDTTLNNACVQSSFGPLSEGVAYELAAAWSQSGALQLGVKAPGGTLIDSFTLTGPAGNWAGNNSLGFGELNGSAGGFGGELTGNTVPDPWDVDETPVNSFTGTRTRALYWNDYAALNPGLADPTAFSADKNLVTGTENVVLTWSTVQTTAGGTIEITSDKPVALVTSSGDVTSGSATYEVDGSFGNTVFTAVFKNTAGTIVDTRYKLVEGLAAPGTLVRPWLGPEYFTSPMHDWRRTGNRFECLIADAERRIDLLPRQLQPTSSLEMNVEVARLDGNFDGLAGFRFAANGGIQTDYLYNILQMPMSADFGFDAGLDSSGNLVLDDQSTPADFPLGTWKRLRLVLTPNGANHDATLELINPDTSAVITSVAKSFPSTAILGNLNLLSDSAAAGSWGNPVTAFRNWTWSGTNLTGSDEQNWGPILFTQYTLSRGILKLSAQFAPLDQGGNRIAHLEVDTGSGWTWVDSATIEPDTELALFRVENWEGSADTPFRVVHLFDDSASDVTFEGLIRRDPVDQDEVSIAALTCQRDLNFPNDEIANGIAELDPDLLFFSGDQFYENDYGYTPKVETPLERARLDMLRKWFMWGWGFKEVTKNRPCICILDDHDNWMANIWGSGGQALSGALANGGYLMPASHVNATQRVQTAHLPDSYDGSLAEQGIENYYTDLVYGRVSFAILEDRKFKTGPNEVGGAGEPPVSDAIFLDTGQHAMIDAWARDWAHADMKAVLCESVFAQCHTHAGGSASNEINPIVADKDANGWPPVARNEAVRKLRKAFPFMIGGDNHLPTLSHLGVDAHEDAFVAYSNPATAVGFPRKWDPANDAATAGTKVAGFPDYPLDNYDANPTFNGFSYLGRYTSDHGHPHTLLAVGNPTTWGTNLFGDVPVLDQKSSGLGVVRFNKRDRTTTVEAYRILADFSSPSPAQFDDWPVVIHQTDNYGRAAVAYLPAVTDSAFENPVFEIIDEATSELLYSIRSWTPTFRPHVFSPTGNYTIRYGEPETDTWVELTGQTPIAIPALSLNSFTSSERFIIAGQSVDLTWDTPGATSLTIDNGVGDVLPYDFNGTGLVSVAPTSDTTYTLTANDGGSPDMATVTVRVFPILEDWKSSHFSPGELLDPLVSGNLANPDGDPFNNWTEYLLQFDPRTPDPALSGEISGVAPSLIPSFTVPEPLLPGYAWLLESTTTLPGPWTPLSSAEISLSTGPLYPPTGTPQLILTPTAPWPNADPETYLRTRLADTSP